MRTNKIGRTDMSLIKLINTPIGDFVYDAITNKITRIFDSLAIEDKLNNNCNEEINELLGRHCYADESIKICPPLSYNGLKNLIEHNCSQLVLSITETCNMRCEYCGYHDRYDDSVKLADMRFSTAQRAIKDFVQRSVSLPEIVISFYGGEPLLRFDFIKQCVQYAKDVSYGQHIKFHITTNGLLLDGEIVTFLRENNFVVSVSLDGHRTLHDRYRITVDKNSTYDIIINNLKNIYYHHTEFFCNNFIFMPVYAPPKNDVLLFGFFEKCPINFMLGGLYVTPYFRTIIETQRDSNEILLTSEQKLQYAKFAQMNTDSLHKYKFLFGDNKSNCIERAFPAGNCIPACKKVFCNANGDYFLCEKVSETKENCIGNVIDGIDVSRVYEQYNRMIVKYEQLECNSCWAIHFCSVCFRDCNNVSKRRCDGIRSRVEQEMIASVVKWGKNET